MKSLFKIAAPGIVIIFSLLFYSGEIVTEINSLKQQRHENKMAMKVFYLAMEIQTVMALQYFISMYPTHLYVELAESTIERLQYIEVTDKNTIEAYSLYLNKFPESKYGEKVSYKRSVLINTIVGYESHLLKYPKGQLSKNALYKKARLIDTVEGYNDILENVYPDNNAFIYYRDKAALDAAKKINTKEAFIGFIEKYPKSSLLDMAKDEIDKLALNLAKKIGTKEAFGEFVDTHPNSLWVHQAKYYYIYGYNLD
jgi:hypothetical protein